MPRRTSPPHVEDEPGDVITDEPGDTDNGPSDNPDAETFNLPGDNPPADNPPADETTDAEAAKRRKRQEAADRAAAQAAALAAWVAEDPDARATVEDVPDDAPPVQVKEVVRGEFQAGIDTAVKQAHEQWVGKGRPGEFNASPRKRRVVPPEHVEALRDALRSAGRLHNVRVRISPAQATDNGMSAVYFVVTDRAERKSAATTEAAPEESAGDKAAQAADESGTEMSDESPPPDSEG